MTHREMELEDRIRQKDADALSQYIELKRDWLLGMLMNISSERLRSKVELQDLLQEISLQAINSLSTAPLESMPITTWLRELAKRKVVDSHRHFFGAQKRSGDREVSLQSPINRDGNQLVDLIIQSITSPSSAMQRNHREQRLWTAVNDLAEDQKQAIQMRYVDGLQTKEIAEKLGKSDASIRVMLSRIMRRLESELADVRPSQ